MYLKQQDSGCPTQICLSAPWETVSLCCELARLQDPLLHGPSLWCFQALAPDLTLTPSVASRKGEVGGRDTSSSPSAPGPVHVFFFSPPPPDIANNSNREKGYYKKGFTPKLHVPLNCNLYGYSYLFPNPQIGLFLKPDSSGSLSSVFCWMPGALRACRLLLAPELASHSTVLGMQPITPSPRTLS